jgi:hypothetical protein
MTVLLEKEVAMKEARNKEAPDPLDQMLACCTGYSSAQMCFGIYLR